MADTITEAIMQSIVERLQAAHGNDLAVQFFPQSPDDYHLAHPVGAVLVGYSKSSFGVEQDTGLTFVERQLTLPLTLVFCQLNGPDGVIGWLDRLRETLTGFTPAHCDAPLRPTAEYAISETSGIWQYGQEWATRTVQVQAFEAGFASTAAALLQPNFEGAF